MNNEVPSPSTLYPSQKKKMPWWAWLLIIGATGLPCIAILAAILFPVFSQARLAAQQSAAMSSAKLLCTSMNMYALDFDDRLPPGSNWETSLAKYLPTNIEIAPKLGKYSENNPRFAMNKSIEGRAISSIKSPGLYVLLFLSKKSEVSSVGGKADIALVKERGIFGFVDGSVRARNPSESNPMVWENANE